jgi:NAD(P)-dependent dehydrogenase (short-subunit alcohol dehydrogenase family)
VFSSELTRQGAKPCEARETYEGAVNDFKNKHALVTGAASGIGRVTAIELAKQGAVLSLIDHKQSGLRETETMVSSQGSRAESFQLDVTDTKMVSAVLAKIEENSGSPDYLVNTAGIFCPGPVESVRSDEIQKCFAVNTFAVFQICGALLPGMMKRGSGAIVNISSLHAQNGQPNRIHKVARARKSS